MNLIFRLMILFFESLFRKRLHPLSESILHLTVLPNDLDLNFHMNNGRFQSVMDLGRLDLILRTGLMKHVFSKRWAPLVGGFNIRYRQSLKPFQRYRLHTKIIGWDEKWFYMEQRVTRSNRLIAVALVKTLLRGHKRNIPPPEVLRTLHMNIDPPEIPERVLQWLSMDEPHLIKAAKAPGNAS